MTHTDQYSSPAAVWVSVSREERPSLPCGLPLSSGPRRKLLCFPRGSQGHRHVSLFLEYPEAAYTPNHLSPHAYFKLIVKNHKDSTKDFVKGAAGITCVVWGLLRLCVERALVLSFAFMLMPASAVAETPSSLTKLTACPSACLHVQRPTIPLRPARYQPYLATKRTCEHAADERA